MSRLCLPPEYLRVPLMATESRILVPDGTWALRSVSEGDDTVLVVGHNIYKLQGDKDQLLKYMERKATATGNLEGRTLTVQMVTRPDKQR